jgi:phospholipid/cholesterol/gamma-HCH transport system substrate-binding protein
MPRTRSLAWSELKLGIVGVAALTLLTMIIVAVGGEGGFFTERYPLKARFTDVLGLKPGAVVRLAGKEVGTVTSVEFAGASVEVSMALRTDVRPLVTEEATAALGSLSLLGEPIVDLRATGRGTPLPDWAYVRSVGAGGPFGELTETASAGMREASRLIADVRAGRGTLGKLATDDALYNELNALITSANQVTRSINRGDGTLPKLIHDPAAYNSLRASLDNLQTMTTRINTGQSALGRFLNDEAMGKSLSTTMTNLEAVTGRMTTGEGTMAKLLNEREFYDRINQLTGRIDGLVAGLESGQGTAGMLLKDRQLHESINGAVTELRSLLADIRRDPKKYLRVTVSIF